LGGHGLTGADHAALDDCREDRPRHLSPDGEPSVQRCLAAGGGIDGALLVALAEDPEAPALRIVVGAPDRHGFGAA